MTVEYAPRRRLWLHHYAGTVLPEVWGICFFTMCLALLCAVIYNPMRKEVERGGKKSLLFHIFADCDAFFSMCTTFVTFVLSFFNATVFQRWWKLRELAGVVNGRTVDTALLVSAYIDDEELKNEMIRLLWLAHALHAQSIEVNPDPEEVALKRLASQGLIRGPSELAALQSCSSLASSTPLSIAYGWFAQYFRASLHQIDPATRAGLLSNVMANISAMRGSAADVLMYLSTPVPLAYTHLLEVTVTIYVMIAPMGLVPRLLWMAVPGCAIVTLVFYGFMCVGKLMLNPFDTHASDSFQTASFLRGTRISCLEMASQISKPCAVHVAHPELADGASAARARDAAKPPPEAAEAPSPGNGVLSSLHELGTRLDGPRKSQANGAGGGEGGGLRDGEGEGSEVSDAESNHSGTARDGLRRRNTSKSRISPLLGPALGKSTDELHSLLELDDLPASKVEQMAQAPSAEPGSLKTLHRRLSKQEAGAAAKEGSWDKGLRSPFYGLH